MKHLIYVIVLLLTASTSVWSSGGDGPTNPGLSLAQFSEYYDGGRGGFYIGGKAARQAYFALQKSGREIDFNYRKNREDTSLPAIYHSISGENVECREMFDLARGSFTEERHYTIFQDKYFAVFHQALGKKKLTSEDFEHGGFEIVSYSCQMSLR